MPQNKEQRPALKAVEDTGRLYQERLALLEQRFFECVTADTDDEAERQRLWDNLMEADKPFRSKADLKAVS